MASDEQIRQEAERRVHEEVVAAGHPDGATSEDREALIHELRVHQIELELQNEELRRSQEILERTRGEFMDLYDEAPVGYLSLDAHGVVVRANRTFARMLGRGDDRVVGRHVSELLAEDSREAFLRRFGAIYREPEGKSIDARFRTASDSEIVLHLTARRPAPGERENGRTGGADALRIAAVDVTDRRRAELRVGELLAQKELLLRELSHRTKNNYQTVLAMLELQSNLTDDAHTIASIAQAQARIHAMLVVQESLAEAELDVRTEIRRYLAGLVERIVQALDPEGIVTVSTQFASGYADADTASAIGLVLNELATNAWKHAFAGRASGSFEVSLTRSANGWTLSVRDDGPAPTVPRAGSGRRAGLGLTLIEALANQTGATFERDSNGSGTRCVLRLPAGAIAAAPERSRPTP